LNAVTATSDVGASASEGIRAALRRFVAGEVSDAAETLTVQGWALARAHAKAGDALMIGGYLGSKDACDEAMGDFALAYADQTERDHADLNAAVGAGKIDVHLEA
jgi:uncharacterized protein DUF2252